MMNIGFSPTMTQGLKKVIEVNIFDFGNDIYGKEIEIKFLKRFVMKRNSAQRTS